MVSSRDGNGAGFFGYPFCPLMGWGSILINGFGNFFLKPGTGSGRVQVLPCPAPPHPVYKYMNI